MVRRIARAFLLSSIAAILISPLRPALTDTATKPPPAASGRFFVLYDFGERPSDPIWQRGPGAIADGHDGYLYTTSTSGGTHGYGTVFKISMTDGKPPIVIYNFDLVHGAGPQGGLTRGSDGLFYGTTYQGGKYGVGTIFSVTSTGALTVLWDFRNGTVIPAPVGRLPTEQEKLDAAGSYPVSAPVQGTDGSWYGVTSYANNQQWGVVYQLSGGGYHGVYQFKPADVATLGNFPVSLSPGSGGVFYGTTLKGGAGYGTVYKVAGGAVSKVFAFTAQTQGSQGVIVSKDGLRLYGTATGIPSSSFGFVYGMDSDGQNFNIIHMFGGVDGAVPVGGLVLGKDGALYGATKGGGSPAGARGVLYHVNTDGSNFVDMFNLNGNTGRYAVTAPVEHSQYDPNDNSKTDFYGMTYQGGTHDSGVFYHLNVHMYPPPSHDSYYAGGIATTGPGIPDSLMIIKRDVQAFQADSTGQGKLLAGDGISVQLGCFRDPHIVQFVYREKIAPGGVYLDGGYQTTWGTFPLTTDPKFPLWHTDAIGVPNAYYDQAPGASHQWLPASVTIFDQPSLLPDPSLLFQKVTAKDFGICNGKVIRIANWSVEAHTNPVTKLQDPLAYTNFSIEAPPATDTNSAWSDSQLQWINSHVRQDGYDPVP